MDTNIVRTTEEGVAAGDPFAYAAQKQYGCSWCFGGWLTVSYEEDGEEHEEPMPCKRCEHA